MFCLGKALDELGLTQKEFAEKMSLGESTVSNYVNGRRQPDLDMLCKMCDVLNVTADYLLGRSDTPTQKVSEEEWQIVSAYRESHPDSKSMVQLALKPWLRKRRKSEVS